jgi:hypothetical protein
MRKLFSSVALGVVLLLTVTIPPLIFMFFGTSSMAVGVLLISLLYIFLFLVLSRLQWLARSVDAFAFCVVVPITVLIAQGLSSFLIHDEFDSVRFWQSIAFLLISVLGIFSLVRLLRKIPETDVEFALKIVFYALILFGIAGVFKYAPFPSSFLKPVLFFAEPSHFALGFLPFLLYMVVLSQSGMKLLLLAAGGIIAILLQNLTLIVGILLIAGITLTVRRLIFVGFMVTIFLYVLAADLSYYTDRLFISHENSNLSVLVFMQGWERAYLNLEETMGLGIGFQQFGIIGSHGEITQKIVEIMGDSMNLLDGGSVAPKVVGEFGVLGILMLIAYLTYFLRSARWLRKASLNQGARYRCKDVFFLASFVMYSIDLFVRGTGYFSPSGFLFIASLVWMMFFSTADHYVQTTPPISREPA